MSVTVIESVFVTVVSVLYKGVFKLFAVFVSGNSCVLELVLRVLVKFGFIRFFMEILKLERF